MELDKMNLDEIKTKFPRASASFIAANIEAGHSRQIAKLESNTFDAPLGASKVQKETGGRFLVRVKSFRKRLLDESNLCYKFHEDLCRYSGWLHSDAPQFCHSEVSQEKSKVERTEITITKL